MQIPEMSLKWILTSTTISRPVEIGPYLLNLRNTLVLYLANTIILILRSTYKFLTYILVRLYSIDSGLLDLDQFGTKVYLMGNTLKKLKLGLNSTNYDLRFYLFYNS